MQRIKKININTKKYWNNVFNNSYKNVVRKTNINKYKEVAKYISKDSNILDIGSNFGDFIMYLEENNICFRNYTGFDFSDTAILNAKKEMPRHTWIIGNCHDLNTFEKYNTIVCMQVLEHIDEPIIALKQMYNALTSNGQLLLTVPNLLNINHSSHIWTYSEDSVKRILLNVGFKLVQTKVINGNKNILCIVKK